MDIDNNARATRASVEFLVPFTKILVNHLSAPDISIEDFKKELKRLRLLALLKKMVRLNQYQ